MRRLLDRLASLRLTIGLLVALGGLFLLGLVVPQKQVLQRELYTQWQQQSPRVVAILEGAGLTDVHRSPLALGLWLLFFANLAVVMFRRVPVIRARARIDGPIPDPASAPGFARRALPLEDAARDDHVLASVAAHLRGRRFAVLERDGRLRAVRNRLAPWATLAFHLSFFLVAAGGVTSFYTRFEGSVALGAGERFTGDVAQYLTPPALPRIGGPPDVRFDVESIVPVVEGNFPTGLRILVRDEHGIGHRIEVNRPWVEGDTAFVFKNLGVAPLILVHDEAGEEVFGGFIRLNVLQGREDSFDLLGLHVRAELFPDHVLEAGEDRSVSQEMRNPVLRLTLEGPRGERTRVALRPGDVMELPPFRLSFADWRYWAKLYVRAERGIGLLWTGFAVATIALSLRLLLYRREYVLGIGNGEGGRGLHLAGRADYYRALFEDEVNTLARELEVVVRQASMPGGTLDPAPARSRHVS